MGMLGGLALGGLLGAMLFGGGFEHINLFDFVVLGLVAYMLFRLFAGRARTALQTTGPHSGATAGDTHFRQYSDDREDAAMRPGARFDTNLLFRGGSGKAESPLIGRYALPPGFDERAFVTRAKQAFVYLQKAWDEGDLEELRGLTTPEVFGELMRQSGEQGGRRHQTSILSLDARVLEVGEEAGSDVVSVLFEARIVEDEDNRPSDVKELWHFIRNRGSDRPTWYLDGVQQID